MSFCSGCGNDLAESARFCPRCGTPLASGAAPAPDSPSFAQAPEPLDYTIQGENLQVARVHLKPGQEISPRPAK